MAEKSPPHYDEARRESNDTHGSSSLEHIPRDPSNVSCEHDYEKVKHESSELMSFDPMISVNIYERCAGSLSENLQAQILQDPLTMITESSEELEASPMSEEPSYEVVTNHQ